MKNLKFSLLFILLSSLVLAACQPEEPTDVYIYGEEAIIESVDVILMESFPLQARADIIGNFPDGCTELAAITVDRQGNEFVLTVQTSRPAGDIACTEALVPFEESVELDILGLEAGTYTVVAQDQQASFTLDVDNVLDMSGEGEDYELGSDAVIEDLSVIISESDPVDVRVVLEGYLPDACTEIHALEYQQDGNSFVLDVITQRPTGDVMCAMVITQFTEEISINVQGLADGEYEVRYEGLQDSFNLDSGY
jgi:hypothetical protein